MDWSNVPCVPVWLVLNTEAGISVSPSTGLYSALCPKGTAPGDAASKAWLPPENL